ncbi:MAG: glycosyltransferase [Bacteroidota bacterium]
MKIIHVVDPFAGGLATFLKLLTEELNDNNYHIIVHGERRHLADPTDVKSFFPKKNVKFIFWKSVQREVSPFKDIQAYLELVNILRRFNDADVIHLHSSKAGFLGRIACKQLGIKHVIYTPNGAPFLMKDSSVFKLAMYEKLEKFADYFGGKVICTSLSEQNEYKSRGIEADFINNGTRISKKSFIADKNYNKFRIVTSGRIENQKDPSFFNDIALAFVDLPHFEFVWIGDGAESHCLTSPNIKKTGWLSKEGVTNEIGKADLYLSTSVFEGLPFAVLEAMSLGKCLLLSECIGNVDLVLSGINGEKFITKEEAVNYIIGFYLNREITYSMGMNSIEICRDYFNIEDTAYKYQCLYERVRRSPVESKYSLNNIMKNLSFAKI